MPELLEAAERGFDPSRSDRVVVFAGDDTWLSTALGDDPRGRPKMVARLRRFFGAILYEAMDFRIDGVQLMPTGLIEKYIFHNVGNASVAIAHADTRKKHGNILAAWGYHFWFDANPSVNSAAAWLEEDGAACQAQAWDRCTGTLFNRLPPGWWWYELALHRFMLMPAGSALQGSKLIEALLVLTVPIASREHGMGVPFDELVNLGFPIVVVDRWNDITPGKLNEWWATLSPRLERFRTEYLSTAAYWKFVISHLPTAPLHKNESKFTFRPSPRVAF